MLHDAMMCFLLAKDKGEKKLFGFAFTPLMREDGTTLSDESHELYVYILEVLKVHKLIVQQSGLCQSHGVGSVCHGKTQ